MGLISHVWVPTMFLLERLSHQPVVTVGRTELSRLKFNLRQRSSLVVGMCGVMC